MTFTKDLPLLIFDLDGTLIDSAVDIHFAMNTMLQKYNRRLVDFPVLVSHIGDGLKKLVNDFFPEFAEESAENMEKVNEFLNIYENNMLKHTCLYPGVFKFLNTYQGPKAIVTNKSIHPTRLLIEHFKLNELEWVDVIGGDSLAERKPSALPLLHVMKKAGVPSSKTWMIGDGRPDMQAATNAACVKVAVHYGYSQPHELDGFNPDHVLKTFSDLNELI